MADLRKISRCKSLYNIIRCANILRHFNPVNSNDIRKSLQDLAETVRKIIYACSIFKMVLPLPFTKYILSYQNKNINEKVEFGRLGQNSKTVSTLPLRNAFVLCSASPSLFRRRWCYYIALPNTAFTDKGHISGCHSTFFSILLIFANLNSYRVNFNLIPMINIILGWII